MSPLDRTVGERKREDTRPLPLARALDGTSPVLLTRRSHSATTSRARRTHWLTSHETSDEQLEISSFENMFFKTSRTLDDSSRRRVSSATHDATIRRSTLLEGWGLTSTLSVYNQIKEERHANSKEEDRKEKDSKEARKEEDSEEGCKEEEVGPRVAGFSLAVQLVCFVGACG
jgi:hypothetical protein